MGMQAGTKPDARTGDARNAITARDLNVAAKYLFHAAEALTSCDASTDAEEQWLHLQVSQRLTAHAIAIVLGEKPWNSEP